MEFHSFDREYLRKLAAGDPETVQHFHDYFGALVTIKLRSRRLPTDAVDDIKQETFLRVLRAVRSSEIREAASLGSFVNSVCRFVMIEYERSTSRHQFAEEDRIEPVDESASAAEAVYAAEIQTLVHSVLNALSQKDRLLLSAVFIDEEPSGVVCSRFGVQQNYLRVLLHRARRKFKKILDQRLEGGDARRGTNPAG